MKSFTFLTIAFLGFLCIVGGYSTHAETDQNHHGILEEGEGTNLEVENIATTGNLRGRDLSSHEEMQDVDAGEAFDAEGLNILETKNLSNNKEERELRHHYGHGRGRGREFQLNYILMYLVYFIESIAFKFYSAITLLTARCLFLYRS
eukprot:175945_1